MNWLHDEQQLKEHQEMAEWSLKILGKVSERTKLQVEQWKNTGKIF